MSDDVRTLSVMKRYIFGEEENLRKGSGLLVRRYSSNCLTLSHHLSNGTGGMTCLATNQNARSYSLASKCSVMLIKHITRKYSSSLLLTCG